MLPGSDLRRTAQPSDMRMWDRSMWRTGTGSMGLRERRERERRNVTRGEQVNRQKCQCDYERVSCKVSASKKKRDRADTSESEHMAAHTFEREHGYFQWIRSGGKRTRAP